MPLAQTDGDSSS